MAPEVTKCQQAWKVTVNGRSHSLTLDKLKELHGKLGEIIISESRLHPVIARVAFQMHVKPEDILSRKRTEELVVARWCIYRLLQKEGLSTITIARITNHHRDTVKYGLRTFTARLADSKSFRKQVAWLENGAV